MKGKPWPSEDERKLKDWSRSGITNLELLSSKFGGRYSKEGIRQKLIALGLLKEQQQAKKSSCCSLELKLPKELPTVEEVLKTLAAALKQLEQPGLDPEDTLRLRTIIGGIKIYKELFADYVNYRGIEQQLIDLEKKYAGLAKDKA
jgi:hypothetical protein